MNKKNIAEIMSQDPESANRIRIGHYTQKSEESKRKSASKQPVSIEERAISASRQARARK